MPVPTVRLLVVAALLTGYGALAGCAGGVTTAPPGHAELPGQQGHTHAATGPDRPTAATADRSATPAPVPDHDDVSYLQMMIPHHGQALAVAELAATRAADPRVRAVAERIDAAQGPETWLMAGWLAERGIDVPSPEEDPHDYDHGEHGHHPMVGLLTDDEVAALAAADGAAFDRLFLAAMIRHHEGAIAMATDALAGATDPRVAEIARDVAAGQAAEAARMRRILADLGRSPADPS